MQKPAKFLRRMAAFLVVVFLLVAVLRDAVAFAFAANMALNSVIIGIGLLGIIFAFRRVVALNTEIDWINAFKRQETATSAEPRLLAPAAALLAKDEERTVRLSAMSMRSVLDGIASRLEETREISRYFTGLMIFLGLLGTFWGLLGAMGAIVDTIDGLSVDSSDMALMFDELKSGLTAPITGMRTAFSSSLFGLAGSLVLGFMDLQASQAQTRFYNQVEDWLASVTKLSRGGEGDGEGARPGAYMTALMEQTADGIDRLQRTLKRGEDERGEFNHLLADMSEKLGALGDRLVEGDSTARAEAEAAREKTDASTRQLAQAIERLASHGEKPAAPALDDATKSHIRNLDVGIKRLIDEQSRQSDMLADELRSEIKLLARTIASAMENTREETRADTTAAERTADPYDDPDAPAFLRRGDNGANQDGPGQ
ncbi:flagellar motor protein MotA [Yunchengibacter salinarum]|uniref:flagellar motor protein MotA n=1 Tax=Yunchengibacter salinarum TaxID=3133399 RepID=UPI0035B5B12D